MEILIAPLFFMIALAGFWASLKFSKYKQGQSACCQGTSGCSHDAKIREKKCTKAQIDKLKTETFIN